MSEIKHRQHEPYGCGLFSVANALDLDNYVTPERLKISKKGNNIAQLTRWLAQDGHDYGVDMFYYHYYGDELPAEFLNFKTDDPKAVLPIMLEVQQGHNSRHHLVAGSIDHENNLTLMDSYREKAEVMPLKDINTRYYRVFGFYAFCYVEKQRGWVFKYS